MLLKLEGEWWGGSEKGKFSRMMEIRGDGTMRMTDPLHYGEQWHSMNYRYEKDKELHRLYLSGAGGIDGLNALFEFLPDDTLHIEFSSDKTNRDSFTDEDSFLTKTPHAAHTNSFIGVWSDKQNSYKEMKIGLWSGGKGLISGAGGRQVVRWKLSDGNKAEVEPTDPDPESPNLYRWTLFRVSPTDQAILVKSAEQTKLFARDSEEKFPYSYYEAAVEWSRRREMRARQKASENTQSVTP
jgi:hypothetical protein